MIRIEKDIELTPYELAREVWEKGDEEQAIFFSELGRLFDEARGRGLIQIDNIAMSEYLNDDGRWLITVLSNELPEL